MDPIIVIMLGFLITIFGSMNGFVYFDNRRMKNACKLGNKWDEHMSNKGYPFTSAIKILYESMNYIVTRKNDDMLEINKDGKKEILIVHQFGFIERTGECSLCIYKNGKPVYVSLIMNKSTIELIKEAKNTCGNISVIYYHFMYPKQLKKIRENGATPININEIGKLAEKNNLDAYLNLETVQNSRNRLYC